MTTRHLDTCPYPCPDPNLCRRMGRHIHGRMYEWYACRCPPERPCPPEECRRYRDIYEAEALELVPTWARPFRRIWWTLQVGRLGRVSRFLKAFIRHAGDWFRLVSATEYRRRVEVCLACPHYLKDYPGGRCARCGCGVLGQISDREGSGAPAPWWSLRERVRKRWGKVWGKAHWNSEDCPVCSRCGKSRADRNDPCRCDSFVSKWRTDLLPRAVLLDVSRPVSDSSRPGQTGASVEGKQREGR